MKPSNAPTTGTNTPRLSDAFDTVADAVDDLAPSLDFLARMGEGAGGSDEHRAAAAARRQYDRITAAVETFGELLSDLPRTPAPTTPAPIATTVRRPWTPKLEQIERELAERVAGMCGRVAVAIPACTAGAELAAEESSHGADLIANALRGAADGLRDVPSRIDKEIDRLLDLLHAAYDYIDEVTPLPDSPPPGGIVGVM